CCAALPRTTQFSWSCAQSMGSAWAASGASEHLSPWKLPLPGGAACSQEFCKADIQLVICSPPWPHDLSSRTSDGAPCSGPAEFLLYSRFTFAHQCRNQRHGSSIARRLRKRSCLS